MAQTDPFAPGTATSEFKGLAGVVVSSLIGLGIISATQEDTFLVLVAALLTLGAQALSYAVYAYSRTTIKGKIIDSPHVAVVEESAPQPVVETPLVPDTQPL